MSSPQSKTPVSVVDGFILAGGESKRMGRDKSLLDLGGVPLIVRTLRLVESVVSNPVSVVGPFEPYRSMGLHVVPDDSPGTGPLGGIATALRASIAQWNLIVACDLPYLTKPWLTFLVSHACGSKADAVMPANFKGPEPLCAMYHKRCESPIRAALESGTRKVTKGLVGLHIEEIDSSQWKAFDDQGLLFTNMNTPADYEEARRRLG